jgi:hypothetical protein
MVPVDAVEQVFVETTAVPLEELFAIVVLLKLQFGEVFKVKELEPIAVGVPVAVNTIVCAPVPANVPLAANVTPLAVVVEILYVPTVVTVAVMVWVTPDTATPAVIVPAEAVEQVYPETTAVPSVEGGPAAMQRTE